MKKKRVIWTAENVKEANLKTLRKLLKRLDKDLKCPITKELINSGNADYMKRGIINIKNRNL